MLTLLKYLNMLIFNLQIIEQSGILCCVVRLPCFYEVHLPRALFPGGEEAGVAQPQTPEQTGGDRVPWATRGPWAALTSPLR